MPKGSITEYIDVAQVAIYMFWIFFAGLIYYLLQENKREGYPLEAEGRGPTGLQGFPAMPPSKTYILPNGGTQLAPRIETDTRPLRTEPSVPWSDTPVVPTGDPMRDGVGPAAWAERSEETDKTVDGRDRIVPLRVATDFHIEERDPDPRGMTVYGSDNISGGIVRDVWVDRAEHIIRYLEVETKPATETEPGVSVLLPINFTRIDGRRREIKVRSVLGKHFSEVPKLREPLQVTRREEDRICAYYGGGTLYATIDRAEPLL